MEIATNKSMLSALFWDIMLRRVVFTDVSGQLIGDIFTGPIHCSETSVNNYHTTLRNIPEERRSHQHRGGSLKSNRCYLMSR
jgi:hypothetical protein